MRTRLMIVLMLAGILISACGPSAPATPSADALATAVAQTLQAMSTPTVEAAVNTPAPPDATAPAGNPVRGEGLSFVIPDELKMSATMEAIPEASGPDMPTWGIHPAHVEVNFHGYPLQGTLLKPQIFVYPVAEFSKLTDAAAQASAVLKDVLGRGALPPGPMPFLPVFNAAQVFYSNALVLPFDSGTGIRFLTQFDQAPLPINNDELIYTFQGLTTDGKYYVSAVLPVNAAFLPADSRQNSPTPPEGIPFSWTGYDDMPAYLEAVRQKLDNTAPDAFTPNLTSLDAMMQSLRVEIP